MEQLACLLEEGTGEADDSRLLCGVDASCHQPSRQVEGGYVPSKELSMYFNLRGTEAQTLQQEVFYCLCDCSALGRV